MPVIRKIYHTGNSNTLTIPNEIANHLGVMRGDYLVWHLDAGNRAIVEKLTPKKHPGFFIPGAGWLNNEKR